MGIYSDRTLHYDTIRNICTLFSTALSTHPRPLAEHIGDTRILREVLASGLPCIPGSHLRCSLITVPGGFGAIPRLSSGLIAPCWRDTVPDIAPGAITPQAGEKWSAIVPGVVMFSRHEGMALAGPAGNVEVSTLGIRLRDRYSGI